MVSSFGDVGQHALGHKGKILIDWFLVLTQLCICCVYFSYIADNVVAVLPDEYNIHERMVILVIFPIILIMSWVPSLDKISKFSTAGITYLFHLLNYSIYTSQYRSGCRIFHCILLLYCSFWSRRRRCTCTY